MPKKIDHEERKDRILQVALEIFARDGYRDTNLSVIAQECGISRPIIYQYFKDKEEIFSYATKKVTNSLFVRYSTYAWKGDEDSIQKIEDICNDIIDYAITRRDELVALVDIMVQLRRENIDFNALVEKRIIKLSILFKRLLRLALREGLIIDCDIEETARHILLFVKSYLLQIAFFTSFEVDVARSSIAAYLRMLRKK